MPVIRPLFGERDPDEIDAPRWHVERVTLDPDGLRRPKLSSPVADPSIHEHAVVLARIAERVTLQAEAGDASVPDVSTAMVVSTAGMTRPFPALPVAQCSEPELMIMHGTPDHPEDRMRGSVWCRATNETMQHAYWLGLLPGVAVRMWLHPEGSINAHRRESVMVGEWGSAGFIPAPPPDRIDVQLPDGRVKSLPVTTIGGQPRIILSALDIMPAPPTEKVGMPAHLRERSRT